MPTYCWGTLPVLLTLSIPWHLEQLLSVWTEISNIITTHPNDSTHSIIAVSKYWLLRSWFARILPFNMHAIPTSYSASITAQEGKIGWMLLIKAWKVMSQPWVDSQHVENTNNDSGCHGSQSRLLYSKVLGLRFDATDIRLPSVRFRSRNLVKTMGILCVSMHKGVRTSYDVGIGQYISTAKRISFGNR